MDAHKSAHSVGFHFSDLVHCWQVVEPNLHEPVLCILVSKVSHELCDGPSEVSFKPIEFIGDFFKESFILEPELSQMVIVYE